MGRFEKGNPGGPGRPKGSFAFRRRYAEALSEAVTEGHVVEVLESLRQMAKEDPNAAHILLKYTIGLPKQTIAVEEVKDGFENANDSAADAAGIERLNGLASGHGDTGGE